MSALLDDYISREQLAEELNVTTRTLDNWAWLRKGPPKVRVGNRCYYKRTAVKVWLDNLSQPEQREAA